MKVNNFQTVLNNYIAGYFAVGLLINRRTFIDDLKYFFNQPKWDKSYLLQLLLKYDVSPEVLFQRFNILPKHFDMPKMFFIRMIHDPGAKEFHIDKELHLNRQHQPHANSLDEHYCRRWLSISQLQKLADKEQATTQVEVGVQFSKYTGTEDEYFCFTIARPAYFPSDNNVSVTIGLLADKELQEKINFSKDASIPRKMVSVTCERCPIQNCAERIAPPIALEKKAHKYKMEEALDKMMNE